MNAPVRENSAKGAEAEAKDTGASAEGRTGGARSPAVRGGGELVTELGRTSIADSVVSKIVGMAAREVPGVHAMGEGISRTIGAMRERLPGMGGPNLAQGVAVEVGEREAAIDLDLIAEYGVSIPDLAEGVRRNVIKAVERMCGLQVVEVNITVGDIHLPDEEDSGPAEPRVQ